MHKLWPIITLISFLVPGLLTFNTAQAATQAAEQQPPQKTARTPPVLYSFTEEDDGIFTGQDRHYTQGFLFTRTTTAISGGLWDDLGHGFGHVATLLGAGSQASSHYTWPMVGQSLFTPTNKDTYIPDPKDRPYAGWLYIGAELARRDTSGRTDTFQLLLGDVGSWAMGRQVQNVFHSLTSYGKAKGWDHQLHNEPALLLRYDINWNWALPRLGPLEADATPDIGLTAGNVLTYGAASFTLRIGQHLAAGTPPRTITPGLSGSGWFDPTALDGAFGWFIYGGVQERAVWRNIFLQGNSWQNSPSVPMKHFVTDENIGIAFMFRFGLRVDISYIKRSKEFFGQHGDDRFGSITLTAPL